MALLPYFKFFLKPLIKFFNPNKIGNYDTRYIFNNFKGKFKSSTEKSFFYIYLVHCLWRAKARCMSNIIYNLCKIFRSIYQSFHYFHKFTIWPKHKRKSWLPLLMDHANILQTLLWLPPCGWGIIQPRFPACRMRRQKVCPDGSASTAWDYAGLLCNL